MLTRTVFTTTNSPVPTKGGLCGGFESYHGTWIFKCHMHRKAVMTEQPRMTDAEWRETVQKVKAFAQECFNILGMSGWTFGFDRARRRAGCCRYYAKGGVITLSVHYLYRNAGKWEEITDTILHECAHALVGPDHGHDAVWQAKCIEIGCKPVRCYDSEEVDMPKGNWQATCPGCRRTFHRHRRTRTKLHCRACGPQRGQLTFTWGQPKQKPVIDNRAELQSRIEQIRAKKQAASDSQ